MYCQVTAFGALPCHAEKFTINHADADTDDFGHTFDQDPDSAEEYACGNMIFTRKPPTKEVLEKYSISEAEYHEICDELEETLSPGACGWCV